jgi:hypothetical protein
MGSTTNQDRRYLELHGNQWRVVVNVPTVLHKKLGRKLRFPLGTDSLREANRLKWDVVADLKAQIQEALSGAPSRTAAQGGLTRERLLSEARRFRQALLSADSSEEREAAEYFIGVRAEQIAGKPVDYDAEHHVYFYEQTREGLASEFAGIASGKVTPIDEHHSKYLDASGVKKRTRDDDLRSVRLLKEWCEKVGLPATLQAITKHVAVRFCDELKTMVPGISPVTMNKYVSRLSVYWTWLESRHEVEDNVWRGRRFREPVKTNETKERPFTDAEVVALLDGPASPELHDLMRIAALTGARIDPIVCLRVRDCRKDGVFVFKPQKREPGERLCPIHPDLQEIVKRRTEGRQPDDPMFPEWPAPKENTLRERSFKAVAHFAQYRASVGVDQKLPGVRRSLVNFHSFRRWFITKAEQADQPEHLIAAVVGHKRSGITLGTYSAAPLIAQARRVVEAVRLPTARDVEQQQKDWER